MIHRVSSKFPLRSTSMYINDLTVHTVQKMFVLSGWANRHYRWYRFISLIISERDRCSSKLCLRLRPSLCDVAVSYILCQPFCRKKYLNVCIGCWWKMCSRDQTSRYVGTIGLHSPFFLQLILVLLDVSFSFWD